MSKTTESPYSSDSVLTCTETAGTDAPQWQLAYREALAPRTFLTVLISIAACLAAFTIMAPMDTHDLTWVRRLAYFGIAAFLCAPLCYTQYVVVLYLTRSCPSHQIAFAVATGTLLASLPSTTIVYAVDTLVRSAVPSYGLPWIYLLVASSVLLCSAFIHYIVGQRLKGGAAGRGATAAQRATPGSAGRNASSPTSTDRTAPEPSSKFLDRLSPEVGREIIYLKMSDHYVEVVTTAGRCAILMRFADAVTELEDQGTRVHRSYWVAYPHVRGWEKRNQRTLLRLAGEHRVPVSRTYLSHVRAALARRRIGGDAAHRAQDDPGSGRA